MAEEYENDEGMDEDPSADIKALRAKAKRTDDLEAENAELARRMAFIEAGVNMSSPNAEILMRGWDGELDHDQIRQTAETMGLLSGSTTTPSSDATDPSEPPDLELDQTELDQIGDSANLAVSGTPTSEPTEDPFAKAIGVYDDQRTAGANREDAMALALNSLMGSALEGDQRVLVQEDL